jgi:hypothetical protein
MESCVPSQKRHVNHDPLKCNSKRSSINRYGISRAWIVMLYCFSCIFGMGLGDMLGLRPPSSLTANHNYGFKFATMHIKVAIQIKVYNQ